MRKPKLSLVTAALTSAVCLVAPAAAGAHYHVPYGSEAMADAAAARLLHPASVAGANIGCRPDASHPYPVVLVHATLSDEGANWVTLSPLLANAGYCVYAFNYGETRLSRGGRIDAIGPIPQSAGELAAFVDRVLAATGASQVDLVGHSQGGMMPNYYIKFLGGAPKVHMLIGLAPSNHGTTEDGLVPLLQLLPGSAALAERVEMAGAPALIEQEYDSPFIRKLFGEGEPLAPGIRYVVIETTHDKVVTPFTNAFLHGPDVTDILIQRQCPSDPTGHIGLFEDSPALQNVLNQLGPQHPHFRARCKDFGQGP